MPFPIPIVALFQWQGARQPLPTAPPPFPPPPPTRSPPILTGTLSGVPLVVPRRLRQGNTRTLLVLFMCTHFVSHEILLPCPNDHTDNCRQISETMLPPLLILGSTTLYRGTQVVTLVMPPRYPQPIFSLDIRLDNSRCFSNTSRSRTSSSPLCQCCHGLGIHRLGFHKGRGLEQYTNTDQQFFIYSVGTTTSGTKINTKNQKNLKK